LRFLFFQYSILIITYSIELLHIASGAHGVLTKNKISAKNVYSRPYNHLPQKIPCGRGTIFARRAHIGAKGRRIVVWLW
jgi:hypothetical protein